MYKVDFGQGTATQEYLTPKKNLLHHCFAIFTDNLGLYICTREGKVYLTHENSIFL
jgi:hypothetical protein